MLDKKHPNDALDRDEAGKLRKNEGNLLKALDWAGITLSFDEFALEYRIEGLSRDSQRLDDDAFDDLYLMIDREYYLKLMVADFRRIVRAAARRNRFHPVRAYLAGLRWDGIERIDTWLIDYAGAADTLYARAVSRIVLIAACRRVREPGCKFDEMLVLESGEGFEKSTAFEVLAGRWFSDSAPLHEKPRDVIEQLRGRWIVECADLAGMRRGEVEALKAFLSRKEDASTMKFALETTIAPRQCIFVGTTNERNYLVSTTGNRRFWPVHVQPFNIPGLAAVRDQLWAEAAACEADGESIRLPRELWGAAGEEQAARTAVDEWDELIAEWLEMQTIERGLLSPMGPRTTLPEVAKGALGIGKDKLDQRTIERISKGLRLVGWERVRSNSKRFWQPKGEVE